MTPEQAIRDSTAISTVDQGKDVAWFADYVKSSPNHWRVTQVLVWLLRRVNNQNKEITRTAQDMAGAAIMRQALEEIAEPHACGCPEICHCFSGEGGREIAETMRSIASDALKNAPLIDAVKASQVPPELTGARVGGFTLAQAPEGFTQAPSASRGTAVSIQDVPIWLLVVRHANITAELKRRGVKMGADNAR